MSNESSSSSSQTFERMSSLGSLPDRVAQAEVSSSALSCTTLVAKFGKEQITLRRLDSDTTIGTVKELLQAHTRILPKRQKLVGLKAVHGGKIHDELPLSALKVKGKTGSISANKSNGIHDESSPEIVHQFILMGTPEEAIFVDPSDRDDLPDVIDDFDLDFTAGSDEWLNHVATGENLKKFTEHTEVFFMNPPRDGKPLLVLDLDHTLLDFSSKSLQQDVSTQLPGQGMAARMKRPYMDDFLSQCYVYYDLVVWSQTSWRWLETKLTELGMLTHPGYKFCFVLDKTSMFAIKSTRKNNGTTVEHHVKPLPIIWSKFPDRWSSANTCHVDDLRRNFALNPGSGLKIKAYYRKKNNAATRDAALLGLANYLVQLAQSGANFDHVDFDDWERVVAGNAPLVRKKKDNGSTS